MTTRSAVLPRVVSHLGGWAGTVTGAPTVTEVLLPELQGSSARDVDHDGNLLIFYNATVVADQQRAITAWDVSTGLATIDALSAAPTGEPYVVLPRNSWTLQQIIDGMNEALRTVQYTQRIAIPTMDEAYLYPLTQFTELAQMAGRLDPGIGIRNSPSLLDNDTFDFWPAGAAAAPRSWVLAGSGGTIARSTSNPVVGGFSAAITRAGTNVTLTQSVGLLNQQLQGAQVAAELAGVSDVASALRIGINDGVTTTFSDYHSASGLMERLTVAKTLSSDALLCDIIVTVDADDVVNVGQVEAAEGASIPAPLNRHGSQAYPTFTFPGQPSNLGGGPHVVLDEPTARGAQLLVTARRTFHEVTSPTLEVDIPTDLWEHASVYFIASKHREGQSRDRLDRLMAIHGPAYLAFADDVIDIPAPRRRRRRRVGGA